jgi:hypothetical protein
MSSYIKLAFAPRSHFYRFTFSVTYFLLHALVFAKSSVAQVTELSTGINEPANYDIQFDYQYNSYLRNEKNYFATGNKSDTLNTVGLKFSQAGSTSINAQWFYSEAEQEHYFNIPEFSKKIEDKNNYSLWLGRHQENWSVADEFWALGEWQPRFQWDKLRTSTNGLIGVFYKPVIANSTWHLMSFISPLYIPEMGAAYQEKDNRIVSVNPWFRTPPPILELFDKPTEITAHVAESSYSEMVLKPSIGLQVAKDVTREETVQFSYAYKPMNSLLTSIEYILMPKADDWTVDFTAIPIQVYHHITTLEYNRKANNFTANLSLTYNAPIVPERPEKELSQDLTDSTMYSATSTTEIFGKGAGATQLYAGVMYLDGGIAKDRGSNAQETSLYEYIPTFFQATKLGLSKTTRRNKRRSQKMALELLYDSEQKGGIILTEYAFSPVDNVNVSVKMDILGMMTNETTEYQTGFINTYKANDRLQMDVNYVF